MLQQPRRLALNELRDHIAQHRADGVEALVGLADIGKTGVIEKNLLYDEYGDGLAKLGAGLHDAKTKRNDLGCEKKVDHIGGIILDERANNTEGGQAQIFEWTRFGSRIEEGVEEKRDVC